jgi:GNAT superfamily N-acetyltransferase
MEAVVNIRPMLPEDYEAWRGLWRAYCDFYEAEVSEEVSIQTWNRLMDPGVEMFAYVAEVAGAVAGFAHCVVHHATWVIAPSCYLEDLFTHPDYRRQGIARAMMERLLETCRARGYSRLYWHTHQDNARARALYEQYVPADAFVRYRICL